jgi:hypothetical protein
MQYAKTVNKIRIVFLPNREEIKYMAMPTQYNEVS